MSLVINLVSKEQLVCVQCAEQGAVCRGGGWTVWTRGEVCLLVLSWAEVPCATERVSLDSALAESGIAQFPQTLFSY